MAQKRKSPPPRSKTRTAWDIEIARIKREAFREAAETAFHLMLGLPTMVLTDKHGWGKEQVQAFAVDVHRLYMSFEDGYISMEDVHKTLREELEIEVILLDDKNRPKR